MAEYNEQLGRTKDWLSESVIMKLFGKCCFKRCKHYTKHNKSTLKGYCRFYKSLVSFDELCRYYSPAEGGG